MKRRVAQIVTAVIVANLATWLFVGRSSTLMVAADNVLLDGEPVFLDTVNVFMGRANYLPVYYTQYADYSKRTFDKFEKRLKEVSGHVVIHYGGFDEGQSSLGHLDRSNAIFSAESIRLVPCFAQIDTGIHAGSGSQAYSRRYVWLFRWWLLSERTLSAS